MRSIVNRQPLLLRERSGSTSWPPFKTTINSDEYSDATTTKMTKTMMTKRVMMRTSTGERGGEWRRAEHNATIKQRMMMISRTTTRTTTKITIN